jgi:hypothetical protein
VSESLQGADLWEAVSSGDFDFARVSRAVAVQGHVEPLNPYETTQSWYAAPELVIMENTR